MLLNWSIWEIREIQNIYIFLLCIATLVSNNSSLSLYPFDWHIIEFSSSYLNNHFVSIQIIPNSRYSFVPLDGRKAISS
jgi:hypothetical protein